MSNEAIGDVKSRLPLDEQQDENEERRTPQGRPSREKTLSRRMLARMYREMGPLPEETVAWLDTMLTKEEKLSIFCARKNALLRRYFDSRPKPVPRRNRTLCMKRSSRSDRDLRPSLSCITNN